MARITFSLASLLIFVVSITGATLIGRAAHAGLPGLYGDLNCNGVVDPIDASLALQLGAGLISSLPCLKNGDINGDGRVDALDSALILQYSAGLLGHLGPAAQPTNTPTRTPTRTPTPIDTATPPSLPMSTPTPTNTPTSTAAPTNTPSNTTAPTNTPTGPAFPTPSGQLLLYAADDEFLGVVTCDPFETDGIFNRFGVYGSRFANTSIWYPFGQYGGPFGAYSPHNSLGTPPVIYSDDEPLQFLTVSPLYTPRVTPLDLVLLCFEDDEDRLEYWLDRIEDNS